MRLSKKDADLFFELMLSLHLFVNKQRNIILGVDTLESYKKLTYSQKIQIRDTLIRDISLIDHYIEENPQHLSKENINIVDKWHHHIAGEFFIERCLKKHAIFILENKVYGVIGLTENIEDVLWNVSLPVCVKAVLLPFKGKIVYDGLFERYNVHFGHGISSNLKETYLIAKQNENIINSLDEQKELVESTNVIRKDWRPEIRELLSRVERLHSVSGGQVILNSTFTLIKASIELTNIAVNNDDISALCNPFKKVKKAVNRIETIIDRADRNK
jgi:hypothetical protein